MIGACAKEPRKGKPLPPKAPGKAKPAEPSLPTKPAPALTPKREASQKIVRLGENYLESNELDKAIQTFQEAINVDFENGIAYYFLAKAFYQKGDFDDALGVLDRAQSLLVDDEEWLNEVFRLRLLIEEAKAAGPEQKPSDKDIYY
ncbi:MAG: tetratricopeptide repeat protein [bacterium]|nr:tetratricopeptide repeat protein [bacterium]